MSLAKTTATLLIAISLASTTHGIATQDKEVHHDTIEAPHVEPKHAEEHHKDLHDDSHVAAAPTKNPFVRKLEVGHLNEQEKKSDVFDHVNHEEHNEHPAAHPVPHIVVPIHRMPVPQHPPMHPPMHGENEDYDEFLTDDEGHHIKKHVHGGPGFEAVTIKSDGPLKP